MTTTQHAAFILQVFQQDDTVADMMDYPTETRAEREKICWLYRENRREGQSFTNAMQNAKTTWLTEYLAKMAQQWPSSGPPWTANRGANPQPGTSSRIALITPSEGCHSGSGLQPSDIIPDNIRFIAS